MGKFLAAAERPNTGRNNRQLRACNYKHLQALVPVRTMPFTVSGPEIALLPARTSVYIF
jgi:hypothetical protein